MKLGATARTALKEAASKGVYIEGNVLKMLEDEGDSEFAAYIKTAVERDKDFRRKRLEVTKQIQKQNGELLAAQAQNSTLMEELRTALAAAETAKASAERDLDILQRRTQLGLMERIVRVALGCIIGVGILTTVVYLLSLAIDRETDHIGTVWASLIGIMLTNSFSIIGTIMGVKYATDKEPPSE